MQFAIDPTFKLTNDNHLINDKSQLNGKPFQSLEIRA